MKFSLDELKQIVDEPYFSRANNYVQSGLVEIISSSDNTLQARIAGTSIYQTTLTREKNRLIGTCNCTAFYEYGPCKHIAATGLVQLAQERNRYYQPSQEYFEQVEPLVKIEKHLKEEPKEKIIELILDLVAAFPEILEELSFMVDDED